MTISELKCILRAAHLHLSDIHDRAWSGDLDAKTDWEVIVKTCGKDPLDLLKKIEAMKTQLHVSRDYQSITFAVMPDPQSIRGNKY